MDDEAGILDLGWVETGALPIVQAPERRGFGSGAAQAKVRADPLRPTTIGRCRAFYLPETNGTRVDPCGWHEMRFKAQGVEGRITMAMAQAPTLVAIAELESAA